MKITKAKSKGARKRQRKISLPGGASAPERATGRDRRHTNQPADDPRQPALAKRAKDIGLCNHEAQAVIAGKDFIADEKARLANSDMTVGEKRKAMSKANAAVSDMLANARMMDSRAVMQAANLAVLGHDLGKCINALSTGDEQSKLIDTWETLSASHRNYRMRYIGQTGDPKGASIGMVPDRTETDQSLRVDLRTPEEKAEQAKASWAAWEAKINALPSPQLKWAIRGVLQGFMGEATLWRDQAPATAGRVAVAALRRLCATS